jgi:glucose-1-phosphate adenylyltransferase
MQISEEFSDEMHKLFTAHSSVIMNDTTIKAGALINRCVLDKEIEIGAAAQVGVGDDNPPNQLEPANLNTGITIVGKWVRIPAGAIIGRNCRIDPSVTPDDFERMEIPSGGAVSRGKRRSE